MLKNVAFDSAATALALWEEAKGSGVSDKTEATPSTTYNYNTASNRVLTSIVFPFPGGPNKSKPRAGDLRPVKS